MIRDWFPVFLGVAITGLIISLIGMVFVFIDLDKKQAPNLGIVIVAVGLSILVLGAYILYNKPIYSDEIKQHNDREDKQ